MASALAAPVAGNVEAEPDDELFETFDEAGVFQGTRRRAECHAQGIWHNACYCLVFDRDRRLLIQRRSTAKKVMPGRWDLSVAEHLSPGESFQQAVLRGLKEELGLQVDERNTEFWEIRARAEFNLADFVPAASDDAPAAEAPPQQEPRAEAPTAAPAASAAAPPPVPEQQQQERMVLKGPLTPRHQRRLDLPDIKIHDHEFVETWRLDGLDSAATQVRFNTQEVSEVAWVTLAELQALLGKLGEGAFTPWFVDEARLLGLI